MILTTAAPGLQRAAAKGTLTEVAAVSTSIAAATAFAPPHEQTGEASAAMSSAVRNETAQLAAVGLPSHFPELQPADEAAMPQPVHTIGNEVPPAAALSLPVALTTP